MWFHFNILNILGVLVNHVTLLRGHASYEIRYDQINQHLLTFFMMLLLLFYFGLPSNSASKLFFLPLPKLSPSLLPLPLSFVYSGVCTLRDFGK